MNKNLIPARLVLRINRFVATVLIDNIETDVYVPNTGRLSELALPEAHCLLAESHGKYKFKLLYIISDGFPVMIDSTLSNSLFAELLMTQKVPGLEKYQLVKREPVFGSHRFDYLLAHDLNSCYVELKSCTLFYKHVASFPDAVSTRASEHIRELSSTKNGKLIILILNDHAEIFIPNYHTDYEFYQTLKNYSGRITISAFRISYNSNLVIEALSPVPVHIPEVTQAGYFFIVLEESTGNYYIYRSAYTLNVFDAVKRIKSRGNVLNKICGITVSSRILKDFPVINDAHPGDYSLEVFKNNNGYELAETCSETGRIFRFSRNPLEQKWFHDHILELRFSQYLTNPGH